jgi:hypothetical protein
MSVHSHEKRGGPKKHYIPSTIRARTHEVCLVVPNRGARSARARARARCDSVADGMTHSGTRDGAAHRTHTDLEQTVHILCQTLTKASRATGVEREEAVGRRTTGEASAHAHAHGRVHCPHPEESEHYTHRYRMNGLCEVLTTREARMLRTAAGPDSSDAAPNGHHGIANPPTRYHTRSEASEKSFSA